MFHRMMQFAGSLVSDEKEVVASWDIEQGHSFGRLTPLQSNAVFNMNDSPRLLSFSEGKKVNFINAMGVTIGDSIVGLNVCHYLKQCYPAMHIHLVRPMTPQPAVDAIYARAQRAGIIDTLSTMPWPLARCGQYDLNIDMGNQLFRDSFQHLEMHDYFFQNAGFAPQNIPDDAKQNRWLRLGENSTRTRPPFVLFCPGASTPLRAIPRAWHKQIITGLQHRFALPVLGFSDIVLPGYHNISEQVTTTQAYIDAICQAHFVYTADSSALHIAAGFDLPTHAIFTSISPALRTRYYPRTRVSVVGDTEIEGMHASNDALRLARLHQAFAEFYQYGIW